MGAQAVRLSNVDIDNALKNKDFEVLFQPIFDLGNGALARVETFVRWRHPALGVLPPGAFISFFESQGRMSELTRYVLDQALLQYREWRGPSAPGFSINLALSDLADEAFASHFAVLLRDRGFPADLITLECPMPPVTVELAAAAEHFRRLAATGARLAIEVRGRANDFLRQIEPFPFDEIKTGGAAILRFARTVRGPGLSAISELLEIASKANAAITAVGVEDQASLSALRGLGFAAAQGNHLGKVGPLSAFTPSRVNEVRHLLGLEPLSAQDLHALFRTEAPAPQSSADTPREAAAPPTAPAVEREDSDALVERLAARLARQAAQEAEAQAPAKTSDGAAAAKAAAIARAKRKAAAKEAAEPSRIPAAESGDASRSELAAARSLQERLSREFAVPVAASAVPAGPHEGGHSADEFDFPEETSLSGDTGAVEPQRQAAPMTEPVKKRSKTTGAASKEKAAPAAVAPETVAAETAPAEAPAISASGVSAPAASADGSMVQASLAVGRAHAFFRPGLRVAAVRRVPAPPVRQTSAAAQSAATPPVSRPAETTAASAPAVAPDMAPAPLAGAPEIEALENFSEDAQPAAGIPRTEEFEDEAASNAHEPTEPVKRKRSRNFLTRKYQVWPTHFWPRSWKRAWRRREAEIDRRRSEGEAAASEDAAALE